MEVVVGGVVDSTVALYRAKPQVIINSITNFLFPQKMKNHFPPIFQYSHVLAPRNNGSCSEFHNQREHELSLCWRRSVCDSKNRRLPLLP